MLQNSTPCSVMEQMFVIENHMFCNIRLQTSNMPETRFCCGGVAGRLREHRFWWGFCFQNSEFGCWTRRWISWSSNGSHGLPMVLMVFPSMSAVAPPNDPGHPKSLFQCIAAICHSMALNVSWNMAPCGAMGAPPPS